jgi:hypothetical protein
MKRRALIGAVGSWFGLVHAASGKAVMFWDETFPAAETFALRHLDQSTK